MPRTSRRKVPRDPLEQAVIDAFSRERGREFMRRYHERLRKDLEGIHRTLVVSNPWGLHPGLERFFP